MPKRRLTAPPDDLQWYIRCRKVLVDRGAVGASMHVQARQLCEGRYTAALAMVFEVTPLVMRWKAEAPLTG